MFSWGKVGERPQYPSWSAGDRIPVDELAVLLVLLIHFPSTMPVKSRPHLDPHRNIRVPRVPGVGYPGYPVLEPILIRQEQLDYGGSPGQVEIGRSFKFSAKLKLAGNMLKLADTHYSQAQASGNR
eukprot:2274819-Rhodomonas_salina.1